MAENNLTKNKQGYGYKYTDLAEIHDYLEKNNMKYIQKIERIADDDYIMTKRYIDGKWEEDWIQGSKVVDATLQGIKNPAQEQGSALTYARRYSLLMAFGLATEDDDGAKLGSKKTDKITDLQLKSLKKVLTDEREAKMLVYFKVKNIEDLNAEQYSEAMSIIKKESKD